MSKIIAECGVNHNGDFERAKQMVETAAYCGADIVKFQTFWDIGERLKKYEFTKEQWVELKELANSLTIEFMSTPHWGSPLTFYKDEDLEVIDFVDTLVKYHKVASPYLTNKKYLEYIASKGKPLFISTGSINHENGMATNKEIKEALSWIPQADITLLHCVSKYPLDKPNYKRIRELKKIKKPVGLSDHSLNKMIQCFPVVEKHFKLDDDCIDANVSLNPEEFREMVRNIRNYQILFK